MIFNSGKIPLMWGKTLISPNFKGKGQDKREPRSYRPVSVICNTCKYLSSIIVQRPNAKKCLS